MPSAFALRRWSTISQMLLRVVLEHEIARSGIPVDVRLLRLLVGEMHLILVQFDHVGRSTAFFIVRKMLVALDWLTAYVAHRRSARTRHLVAA